MDDPDPDIFPDELGGRDFVSKRILPLQIEPKVGNLDKNTRRPTRPSLLYTSDCKVGLWLRVVLPWLNEFYLEVGS